MSDAGRHHGDGRPTWRLPPRDLRRPPLIQMRAAHKAANQENLGATADGSGRQSADGSRSATTGLRTQTSTWDFRCALHSRTRPRADRPPAPLGRVEWSNLVRFPRPTRQRSCFECENDLCIAQNFLRPSVRIWVVSLPMASPLGLPASFILIAIAGVAASYECHFWRDIQPCSCKVDNKHLSIACENMNSFGETIDLLANKFSVSDHVFLSISRSNLADLNDRSFKELNMTITNLKLNYNQLRYLQILERFKIFELRILVANSCPFVICLTNETRQLFT